MIKDILKKNKTNRKKGFFLCSFEYISLYDNKFKEPILVASNSKIIKLLIRIMFTNVTLFFFLFFPTATLLLLLKKYSFESFEKKKKKFLFFSHSSVFSMINVQLSTTFKIFSTENSSYLTAVISVVLFCFFLNYVTSDVPKINFANKLQ